MVAPGDVPTKNIKKPDVYSSSHNHGSWGSLLGLVSFRVIFPPTSTGFGENYPPSRSSWTPTLWDAIGSCSTWRRSFLIPEKNVTSPHPNRCLYTLQDAFANLAKTQINVCYQPCSKVLIANVGLVFSVISNAFFYVQREFSSWNLGVDFFDSGAWSLLGSSRYDFIVQIRPTFNQSAWPIAVYVQPVQLQLCMWEMSPWAILKNINQP